MAESINLRVNAFLPEGTTQPIPVFEIGIQNGEEAYAIPAGSWNEFRHILEILGGVFRVLGHSDIQIPHFDEKWVMDQLRQEGSFQLFPGKSPV
ncbi:MAG: hypothetical protein KJI72_03880 [Patescibacteria group bacterium]|nr:hypothetical protein [Patescibacteria group bacterium]